MMINAVRSAVFPEFLDAVLQPHKIEQLNLGPCLVMLKTSKLKKQDQANLTTREFLFSQ